MGSDLLKWKSSTDFEIGGYVISMDYEHGGSRLRSEGNKFLLMKAKNFLGHYSLLCVNVVESRHVRLVQNGWGSCQARTSRYPAVPRMMG